MKYHINYDVLIIIVLIFVALYFLSHYKEAPVFNQPEETTEHYNNPQFDSPVVPSRVKGTSLDVTEKPDPVVKFLVKSFEANNYPCNPGYIDLSPNFWNGELRSP